LAPSKTGPSRTADRVVVLAEGQIIEDGPPGQVLDEPQMPRTQQFLSQMLI
jgi:ABC-type glutathione transport system ATPase component